MTAGTLYCWEFGAGASEVEVAVDGPLTVNDADLAVAAALDGVGVAYVLGPRVLELVAASRSPAPQLGLTWWCPLAHRVDSAVAPERPGDGITFD